MSGRVDHHGLSSAGTWERYRLIADNSRDVVLISDLEGRFVWVQPSIERLLGWTPEDVVGRRGRDFLHPDDVAATLQARADVLEHKKAVDDLVLRYLCKDGSYKECAVHGQPRLDPRTGEPLGGVFILRDDAGQIAALRALATLSRAAQIQVTSRSEQDLLDGTCRAVVEAGRFAYAWYVREVDGRLLPVASSGGPGGWLEDALDATGGEVLPGAPSARALATGQLAISSDLSDDPALEPWRSHFELQGLRSAVGLPVRTDDTLDGALVVYAAEPRAFDDDVPAALLDLAATLGFGLARLRDQHEREALLVRSEAEAGRLRATLDSLFDPLALLEVVRDESGRAVDLRYAEANDAAVAYNRTTREEMLGRTMLELFPNLGDEGPLAAYLHCAETGEPAVFDDYAFPNQMMGEERRYDLRAMQTPDGISLTWRDVTERWRAARRVADDERRYRLVAEHGSDILWELDPEGRLVWSSASLQRILGWRREDLVGAQTMDLIHPDDLDAARDARTRVQTDRSAQGEYRMRCADGSYHWVEARSDLLSEEGHRIVAMRDVQAERMGRAELDHLVAHDPTTGAPTRAVLLSRLDELLANASTTVALFCADVDGLSRVNESLSYAAGDQVLAVVADRMAQAIGDWDRVGRGSGDELLAVIPDLTEPSDADRVAEDIRAAVRQPIEVGDLVLQMTVSIGIATAEPGSGIDPETMLRDAGLAMSQAKEYGGDQAAYVDPELSEQASRRLHLEREIREGLAGGEFRSWLQPIVSLETGEVRGYESLVRWIRADGSIVAPFEFLPLAERSGLIVDLDAQVLDRTLSVMGRLDAGTTVAINLAALSLRKPDLPDLVLTAIERHGVDPGRVHLEVTETALLDDVSMVRQNMVRLAEAGVRWYVDDFGTGYSSISHLRDLPIAGLKLDRSFTFGVAEGDRRCSELSLALVGLAEGLGLDGVAEGVETEAVARVLEAHGWKHGQGWLFGRPAPVPD